MRAWAGEDEAVHGVRPALVATVLANLAAATTYSALPVALADIAAALGVTQVEEVWTPDSFLLAVVCITPLSAWLIARLGTRRLLSYSLGGLVVATAAAAACASFSLLLALVFVQGLCAAPIPPAIQALVAAAVPRDRRNTAMALWSGGTMLGVMAGATLGGVITEQLGWRWIFALGIPFALAALRPLRNFPGRPLAPTDGPTETAPAAATDWLGTLLLVTTLLAAGVALDLAADLDPDGLAIASRLGLLALVTGAAFVVQYRRVARPVLDLSVMGDRNLAVAATTNLVVTGSSTGIFQTVMLATEIGFSAETLGVISAFRGAALLAGIGLGGLASRGGRAARAALIGLVILIAGKFGYTLWGAHTTVLQAALPGVATSLGFGMLSTCLAVMAFASIDRSRAAAASVFVFAGVAGSALGVALLDLTRAWRATVEATAAGGAMDSYINVFWIELIASALLLPLLIAVRPGRHAGPGRAAR